MLTVTAAQHTWYAPCETSGLAAVSSQWWCDIPTAVRNRPAKCVQYEEAVLLQIICQVPLSPWEYNYYVSHLFHQGVITSTRLLSCCLHASVGLRWCGLMDRSPEVRCFLGDKQGRGDTQPRASHSHQEKSWKVRAQLPLCVCQSAVKLMKYKEIRFWE